MDGPRYDTRVLRRLVKDLLAEGYALTVHDGEDETVRDSRDPTAIMAALRTTDEDYLIAKRGESQVGWVRLVYGNSPGEVICDYSLSLESALARVNAICAQMMDR